MKKEMSGKVLSLTMVFVMVVCGICGIGFNAFANDVISAELSIENIGHIFTDKNVSVTATIKNTGASAENVKYTFSATDEDGDVVYSKSDNVSVAVGEDKEAVFSFTVPKYGFYNAELKINGATSAKTRFSVIRKSKTLNNRIGMNTHYIAGKMSGYYSNDEITEFQKLVADAGFGQAREGVTWAHYEGTKDIYSLFPEHRNMLQAFENYGQNNLLILGHQNLARNINFPITQSELDAWKLYVENLAEDVKGYGVKDFELWNEINSYYFTDSSGKRRTPTAAEYVELLKVTYPIIHNKFGDEARLFAFAGDPGENMLTFMEDCFKLGAGEYLDGVSIHPYSQSKIPEDPEGFTKTIADVRALMDKYGLENKPLINSETGYMNDKDFPFGESGDYKNYDSSRLSNMDADEQAYNTVRKSALSFDIVEYTDWFVLTEMPQFIGHASNSEQTAWGWLKHKKTANDPDDYIQYEAKPVFVAMANYNALMADTESNGHIEVLDGNGYVYKFKKDAEEIYMAWTKSGSGIIKLDVGTDRVIVCDLYGNENAVKTDNGVISLNISERPQYVIGSSDKMISVDTSTVTFSGRTESPNQRITIAVVKSGKDIDSENENDYVYLNEIRTNENGDYTICFKDTNPYSGKYTIKFRIGDTAEGYETYEYEYVCCVPNITVTDLDGEVKQLSDIDDSQLNVDVEMINMFDKNLAAMVLCGMYKDGKLINVQIGETSFSAENNQDRYEFTGINTDDIDTIKVFLWNSENSSPLIKKITIK